MSSLDLDVQGAMDWVGVYHDGLVDEFLSEYDRIPVFPELPEQVNAYVVEYANALANWVRASDCWGFEVRIPDLLPLIHVDHFARAW